MAKKGEDRVFNISVIGLSGTERDKGPVGVGKSCLCNRFISYVADKYFSDHISVLSQSDFAGRVINNDHFLFWGDVTKTDDGNNFVFNLIEQSEFIDDVSFQPFKTGRTDPYYKRCVASKVQSAEKLMYICKDQLGMETDSAYEQKLMPEGKLNIDGFICCFDVSQVQQRTLEQQVEFVIMLLNGAMKTKKPVVMVTTKTDEANERYVKEVERLLSKREYKNNIPLVGTSAHENVNVEQAFMTLAHMIDKTKTRPKITQFEAVRQRKELLDVATEAYRGLLRINVIDPKAVWAQSRKKLEKESDFLHYIEHFGTDSARKLFRLHIKHLCDEQIRKRESHYLHQLPDMLQHFLPDLSKITESWPTCQRLIQQHPDFDEYFVEVCDENDSWKTTPTFVDNYQEVRIPFDLLSSCDAETCFRNHFNALQAQHRKLQLKRQFKKLLEESPQVSPGKSLEETYLFFVGKDCYNDLKQYEREQVYDAHQNDLKIAARHDLQELLWEKLEIFIHMSTTPNTITQEDIRTIIKYIEDDPRYHMMDRLEEERKVILFNLLGFMECPSRERCYFRDLCAEAELLNIFEGRTFRSEASSSVLECDESFKLLNLVLLGRAGLAEELCKEIRNMCNHDMFHYRNAVYSLDYRPIEEDVSLEYNSFATANFKPHGCLCVYNSRESLEYVRSSLETTLLADLQREEDQTLHGVPIIILHAYNPEYTEKEHIILSHKGHELAQSLHCEFKDIPVDEDLEDHGLHFSPVQIDESLIMVVRGSGQANTSRPCSEDLEPDLRIGMCLMCGDPYDCEIPLGPILNSNPTQIDIDHQSSMYTVNLETNVDNSPDFSKQKIEICISSYHNFVSKMFKDDEDYHMFHGFILVFSTKRKASYATMKAFAENLRNQMQVMPILILAVTDSSGSTVFFTDELSQGLISDGNQLADYLGGEFKMTTANFQQQTPIYVPFFKDAWYKRDVVSESYYSVPSSPPAYGQACLAIDKRPPAPLPRPYDLYQTTKSSTSNSQSTEESEPLYDQPNNLRGGPTSDSEQERPSSTSPPPYRTESPTMQAPYQLDLKNGEQLVRPSMIRKRQGDHAAWAINEPRRPKKKASTFPSDAKLISQDNGRLDDDSRRSSEETIWRDNELYHSRNPKFIGAGRKPSKGSIQAPLALPEHIEISSDYATVKDVVSSPTPESDYASVNDALPDGMLQRVRSQQRKKGNTDSEDSEFSSLEREREKCTMYTKCNRKPTPHKKKSKSKPPGLHMEPDIRHLRIHDRGRERSNSPSDGSEGTGDELQLVRKGKKRRSLKKKFRSPGGSESSGHTFSPQLSDSDNLAGSPPSHCRDLGYEREYSTMPRERLGGGLMATSMDSAELDLNDSGSWTAKMRTMKKQRKEQQKIKEDEKRRKKEEERKQKEQQKMQKKNKKKDSRMESGCRLQEFPMSSANPSLPQFVETCVEYIDEEGMHTEGIYRIPGNKQNVDLLNSKLQDDPCQDIRILEIQVNAVATVLKNFFNDTEPLIPSFLQDELLEAAEMPTGRLLALRGVLKKLHPVNFEVLKYFITHLNRVSQYKEFHNMDTRNLALCLWPTILRIDFMSYDKMATGTKVPAEIVQTLIEQCGFFFHGEDEV